MSADQNHGNNVFVFYERIKPVEGRFDDVLSISCKSAKVLQEQPGLIQFMVTSTEKKGGEVCTVAVWKTKADFQAFMKTDAVAALMKSDDFANIKSWMSSYDAQMTDLVQGWHG